MSKTLVFGAFALVLAACTTAPSETAPVVEDAAPVTSATAETPPTAEARATTEAPATTTDAPATTYAPKTTQGPTTTEPSSTAEAEATTTTEAPAPPLDDEPFVLAGPSAIGGSISATAQGGQPVVVPALDMSIDVIVDIAIDPGWYCEFFTVTCWYEFHESSTWDGTPGTTFGTSVFSTPAETIDYLTSEPDTKSWYITVGADSTLTDPENETFEIVMMRASS